MSDTAEILRKAKALIAAEEQWTQEEFARDHDDNTTARWEGEFSLFQPCSFCALGAVSQAIAGHPFGDELGGLEMPRFKKCRDYLSAAAGVDATPASFAFWNDLPERTHAEVMAVFDKAIALAEAA